MFQYRVSETKVWLKNLIKVGDSGTIIGLPMSGKLRTVETSLETLGLIDRTKVIDLSIAPHKYSEFSATLKNVIGDFVAKGGQIIYLENCSINTKRGRLQIKALSAIRNELFKKFIYIYSFNEDISLLDDILKKHPGLSVLLHNLYLFPYADLTEIKQLITQNEQRFDRKLNSSESVEILQTTNGIPYLIKTYFRDGVVTEDSLSRLFSEFSPRQLANLKNIKSSSINSFFKLGLLDKEGLFRSHLLSKKIANIDIVTNLSINNIKKAIKINDISVDGELNSYEKEILFHLNDNHRISRQEIAGICYGQNKSIDYSDYAIDKIMSRLRKTLVTLGCPATVIKTNRGFGYGLVNEK